MKYLIELPDMLKDEKGNEYEPTGEFRVPVKDDVYMDQPDGVSRSTGTNIFARIILRPKWSWPAWLGGWGFAMDKSGMIWWYSRPTTRDSIGWITNALYLGVDNLRTLSPTFTPPPIADWTVPVINPNWKK